MHSIVSELWDEWASYPQENEENISSEVAGLIAGLQVKKNEFTCLSSSRLLVLRRLLNLWKKSRWGSELNAASHMLVPKNMKGRVQILLPERLYEEISLFSSSLFASTLTNHKNWSWVRGVWGSCGALYVPKSGYYLVVRVTAPDVSKRLGQVLQKARISWGLRVVHGTSELILRDQQEIVAFLTKIGLTGVSLRIEDKAILRSMRDKANRMRNCDTANIKKSLKVAEEQLELALKIKKNGLLETLPANFRLLAEARLEHPEVSLSELGNILVPAITKSTVKYRWKRLCEFIGSVEN